MLLQTIISQGSVSFSDIETPVEVLEIGTDITPTSLYWLRPHLASDFPSVTCDKTYFWVYGSDHDIGSGGIYWGKGNNLDMSDFEELGLIISGDQAETPFADFYTGTTNPFHLYYHVDAGAPGSGGVQRTRVITTTGGLLHTATYTASAGVLGAETGDQHLGYMKYWDVNGVKKAIHYKTGASLPDNIGTWQKSVIASDGFSATRGDLYDVTNGMTEGYRSLPTFGWFFYEYNRWWWIGIKKPVEDWEKWDNILCLCRADDNLDIQEELTELNGGVGNGTWEIFPRNGKFHLYHIAESGFVEYSTWDKKNLLAFT